jgi:hypothetical protein
MFLVIVFHLLREGKLMIGYECMERFFHFLENGYNLVVNVIGNSNCDLLCDWDIVLGTLTCVLPMLKAM